MDRALSLLFVLLLHAAMLWGLWQHRMLPDAGQAMTLFVNFIAPPAPEQRKEPEKPLSPRPKPIKPPPTHQIVAVAPVVAPTDYVIPAPPPAPLIEAPPAPPAPVAPAPPAMPTGPITLGTELSVACPERTPPLYPMTARRFGEEGTVVLRVELDETGRVANAHIKSSSGYPRLDEAALTVIRSWRCTPAQRNGQPVRATALQPFKFILQGS